MGKEPIILDTGDLFFTSNKISELNQESEKYRAEVILTGYEKIGCDAINIGDYEFALGLDFFLDKASKTELPFISANILSSKTGERLFPANQIIQRGDLSVGIIGLFAKAMSNTDVQVKDYLSEGQAQIQSLKGEVDVIVLLINGDQKDYGKYPDEFPDADFIFVSGSTRRTKPSQPQKENGPYLYSPGKQGKYMMVLDLNIKENEISMVDVSAYEEKIKSMNRRFERLQKKDPEKSLDELYADLPNVMKLIAQYRKDMIEAENAQIGRASCRERV